MSKLETNTIDTVSGTSTLQVGSTNTSTITLGVSGDTINVPSGVTIANSGTATGFGGDNTPNFSAVNSGSQTISHDTLTKCSITTETYDSDSAYDASNSNFVVPSGEGGKYHLVASINWDVNVNPNVIRFFKNGSEILATTWGPTAQSYIVGTLNLSASDYIEVYCYQASGGSTGCGSANRVYFSGFKIIE